MYYTYILYSPALDRYYIGQTENLAARLTQHRAGLSPSTASSHDWQYVYYQAHATRREAVRRERAIKRAKSRNSIARYIADPRNACPSTDRAAW
ncbi:MAG: GIY-YIG nuclease family protein [Lentisphaerae bacterium]|nr:GIY-YIG nuclease family protein [Lentisphaerota bacterium]